MNRINVPIFRWRPFDELEEMFESRFPLMMPRFERDLATDVYETDGNIVVEINVAGVVPEKLDISVEGEYLHISGKTEEEKEVKDKNYYLKEIKRGSLKRMIRLPKPVQSDKASAEHKNGRLKITLPKKAEEKTGKIKVRVS